MLISYYVKFIFHISDLIICLSPDWKEQLSIITKLTPFAVLSNPVLDINVARLQRDTSTLKLLYIGAINHNKGIFKLVDYFSTNTFFQAGKIHLSIAGIGDVQTLNDKTAAIHASHRINYLGWISKSEKKDLLLSHDILILPSFYEGLPVSILEALSAQMPVISTHVGAIPDVVIPGLNGWLFDPSDFNQLDAIFKDIFDDPQLIEQYGLSSKFIVTPYLVPSVKLDLENIYNSLI
jgi:glycosyltransferase involved in cell wall biosynthesis